MMLVWPQISIDRNSSWSWSLSTRPIQCHNEPDFIPSCKPTNLVIYIYYGQTYHLKTRVDIWTRIGVFLVDYGMFSHIFIFEIWFFQFIDGINFRWYSVLFCNVGIMMWVFILKIEDVQGSYRPIIHCFSDAHILLILIQNYQSNNNYHMG